MTAEATVQQIITNATATADTARDKAIEFANRAQTAASGLTLFDSPPTPGRPNVVIPPFDPTIDLTGDFRRAYDDAVADFDPAFQSQITSFLSTYFPNFAGCLKTSVDGWLCSTLTDGGTGMQPAVENALWQRSREREILDARRAEDEAVSGFAARGWALPGGVLIDAVLRVQQVLSDKVSTHSRDVMVKQAEIEIENIRFAVDQGVKLRLGVISALVDFLRTWASMKELAIEKAKALLDAKTRLYQSVAAYYGAIIEAARLVLDYDKLQIDSFVGTQEISADRAIARVEAQVNAAIKAAEAMGAMAAAALGSQNTLAEVAHQTTATSSS
ncbi:MAG: hypothetical protein ACREXU_00615 [Gammaproteobacteria bacterium]